AVTVGEVERADVGLRTQLGDAVALEPRVVVVVVVVQPDHALAARGQGLAGVGADEAGGAGDEEGHLLVPGVCGIQAPPPPGEGLGRGPVRSIATSGCKWLRPYPHPALCATCIRHIPVPHPAGGFAVQNGIPAVLSPEGRRKTAHNVNGSLARTSLRSRLKAHQGCGSPPSMKRTMDRNTS